MRVDAHGGPEVPRASRPRSFANAVYHATGRRIRDLPITVDRLL